AATELFAATVLCGRLNGFAIGPSIAAGWLITLMTWPLFGFPTIVTIWFQSPNHAEVLAVLTVMVSTIFHLGRGPLWRSILLAGVIFFRSDTHSARGSDVVGSDSADFGNDYCRKAAVIERAAGIADDHPLLDWHWLGGVGARLRALSRGSAYLFGCGPISGSVKTAPLPLFRRGEPSPVDSDSLNFHVVYIVARAHDGRRWPHRMSCRNVAGLSKTARARLKRPHGSCAHCRWGVEILAGFLVRPSDLVFRIVPFSPILRFTYAFFC